MADLFKYTVSMLLREKGILIWVVLFPLILASLFYVMFGDLDSTFKLSPVKTIVVADSNYESDQAAFLRATLDSVSGEGSADAGSDVASAGASDTASAGADAQTQLLDIVEMASADDASQAVLDGEASAYITVDADGIPIMHTSPLATRTVGQTTVKAVLDSYCSIYWEILETVPALSGAAGGGVPDEAQIQQVVNVFTQDVVRTQQVSVLRSESSGTVRYFYALLGFSSLMSVTVALFSVSRSRANISAVGVRRQIAAMPPWKQLLITILASFVLVFACMLLAFVFMRFVLGVEFGNRDALAVVALAACSLMATGLGAMFGAIPKLSYGAKTGLCTGISCLGGLLAGLYGEPSMQMADWISQNAPIVQLLNPAAQASTAFYDLTYYDSLAPFAFSVAVLVTMALVFFAISAVLMRRQQYASL